MRQRLFPVKIIRLVFSMYERAVFIVQHAKVCVWGGGGGGEGVRVCACVCVCVCVCARARARAHVCVVHICVCQLRVKMNIIMKKRNIFVFKGIERAAYFMSWWRVFQMMWL